MVLDKFGRQKPPAKPLPRPAGGAARDMIAKGNYSKAVESLRMELQKRRGDERLRVQLAETLALAGKKKEAVEILNALADDLALAGQAAKAIAALKRIDRIEPGREDVEEKLAYLIAQQSKPSFDPWKKAQQRIAPIEPVAPPKPRLEFGMEEIAEEPPAAEAASAEAAPAAAIAAAGAAPGAAGAVPEVGADEAALVDDIAALFAEDEAKDELASLIEDVFSPTQVETETAAQAPKALASPLFKDFSEEELRAVIRGLRLRSYEPGEIIVSVGEPGDSMFILTTGRVRAFMRDKLGRHVQVREMRDGDFFGEIAVLSGNPRSATITAASACELLELDRRTLNSIAEKHPNVRTVLQEFYKLRASHSIEAALLPADQA